VKYVILISLSALDLQDFVMNMRDSVGCKRIENEQELLERKCAPVV